MAAANKYSGISSYAGLKAAQEEIRQALSSQKDSIASKYGKVKDHYRPSNLAAGFIRESSNWWKWFELGFLLFKKIKILKNVSRQKS